MSHCDMEHVAEVTLSLKRTTENIITEHNVIRMLQNMLSIDGS